MCNHPIVQDLQYSRRIGNLNYAGTLGTALTLKNRADNVVNNMSDAMSLPLILLHDTPSFVMHSDVQIPSKYTLHEIFCIM